MTLDEAIKHSEGVYQSYQDTEPDCACAMEHKQLAEWLRELRDIKELMACLTYLPNQN